MPAKRATAEWSLFAEVRCIVEFEPKTASVFDGLIACEAVTGCDNYGRDISGLQGAGFGL